MGILDAPGMAATVRAYDALDARKRSMLRTFHARCANINGAPIDWLAVGDSTTEGARHVGGAPSRWENRAVTLLRSRLGQTAPGGLGYVPAWYSTGDQQTPSPCQPSTTGTQAAGGWGTQTRGNYGLGRRCLPLAGSAPVGPSKVTLTLTAGTATACTSVDVIYGRANTATSGLDIYLNGALQTSVPANITSGSEVGGLRYRLTGLGGLSHTIEARATGATAYLEGFMLYNGDETSGLRLWEAAASGSNSAWHDAIKPANKGTPNFIYVYDNVVALQPALVTVMLGINSFYNGTSQTETPSTYAANLTSLVSTIRAACATPPAIVFLHQWERGPASSTSGLTHPWSAYVDAARGVAAADGSIAEHDLSLRFPPGIQTAALGLIHADQTHQVDVGSTFIANSFINWIAPN